MPRTRTRMFRPAVSPTFALLANFTASAEDLARPPGSIRFATFNALLNRSAKRELLRDLATPDDPQIVNVTEIIQRVRPEVHPINEFDCDDHRGTKRGRLIMDSRVVLAKCFIKRSRSDFSRAIFSGFLGGWPD
jgi:hypothetical protein